MSKTYDKIYWEHPFSCHCQGCNQMRYQARKEFVWWLFIGWDQKQ